MVIVDPIPGQETRNSDFLLENGAAVKVNNIASLSHKLTSLLTEPGRLDTIRASARRLARPRAAYDVAQRALNLIQPPAERNVLRVTAPSRIRGFWRTRRLQTATTP
jgi:UDP-N-acetylglucosamine:LPS N-acetylglucosamine transferase